MPIGVHAYDLAVLVTLPPETGQMIKVLDKAVVLVDEHELHLTSRLTSTGTNGTPSLRLPPPQAVPSG